MKFHVSPENSIIMRDIEAASFEDAVLNYVKAVGAARVFDLGIESVAVSTVIDGQQAIKFFNLNLRPQVREA